MQRTRQIESEFHQQLDTIFGDYQKRLQLVLRVRMIYFLNKAIKKNPDLMKNLDFIRTIPKRYLRQLIQGVYQAFNKGLEIISRGSQLKLIDFFNQVIGFNISLQTAFFTKLAATQVDITSKQQLYDLFFTLELDHKKQQCQRNSNLQIQLTIIQTITTAITLAFKNHSNLERVLNMKEWHSRLVFNTADLVKIFTIPQTLKQNMILIRLVEVFETIDKEELVTTNFQEEAKLSQKSTKPNTQEVEMTEEFHDVPSINKKNLKNQSAQPEQPNNLFRDVLTQTDVALTIKQQQKQQQIIKDLKQKYMEAKEIKGIINEQHWSEMEINNMGKIIQMTLPKNVYADLDLSQKQDWQAFGVSLTKDILKIPIIYQNLLCWSRLDKTKVLLVLENQDADTGDPDQWFQLMTQIPQTRWYIPPGVGIINDDPQAYKMLTYTEQILIQSDGFSRPIILQSLEYLLGIIFNLIEEDDHQTIVDTLAELTGKVLELTNRSEVLHEDHLREYYKYNPLVARQLIAEQEEQSDQQH